MEHSTAGRCSYGDGRWWRRARSRLALLDDTYARWTKGVSRLDDAGLAAPVGEAEGDFADFPYAALVLHINREAIHHMAEVALLRDLYRWR